MAAKFLFRFLKNIDPQAQYDAITPKDPFTLYLLSNGVGYLGSIKIFDGAKSEVDETIKNLVTDMIFKDFVPDNVSVASTKAIVDFVKKQIDSLIDSSPENLNTLNKIAKALDEVKNTIPVIPSSLPANGGNADTIGGKTPDDFAGANHEHEQYAPAKHGHNEYALKEHEHDYAPIEHKHDEYADKEHTHTEFALDEHEHDNYASKEHKHDEYAPSEHTHDYAPANHEHDNYALKDNIVPNTRTINNKNLSDNIILTHEDVDADKSGTAEEKANKALEDAKAYTDDKIANINIPTPDCPQVEASLSQLGVTASAEELNYIEGVTSNVQEQLNNKASEKHTHSTDDVTGLSDVAKSGAYKDLIGTPEIPVIPEALPANGGNADTIDGKHASDFAEANHEHADYAPIVHEHDSYASKEHNHTEFALSDHKHNEYASKEHSHEDYAEKEHEHENYAIKDHTHNDYASSSHNHDENYASKAHEHTEYALKDDVSDDIDVINKVIQEITYEDVGADPSGAATSALKEAKAYVDESNTQVETKLNKKADLDDNGLVLTSQLPSYVDDVINSYIDTDSTEFSSTWLQNEEGNVIAPETGKIYLIITEGDYQNKQYRWSGSIYALCNPSDVNSVNGKTGIVELTASDVGAEPKGAEARANTYTDESLTPINEALKDTYNKKEVNTKVTLFHAALDSNMQYVKDSADFTYADVAATENCKIEVTFGNIKIILNKEVHRNIESDPIAGRYFEFSALMRSSGKDFKIFLFVYDPENLPTDEVSVSKLEEYGNSQYCSVGLHTIILGEFLNKNIAANRSDDTNAPSAKAAGDYTDSQCGVVLDYMQTTFATNIMALVADAYGPHIIYDDPTGFEANDKDVGNWQLTGLDLTPYKRVKFYIKAAESGTTGSPSHIVEIHLDDRAKNGQGHFTGGHTAIFPDVDSKFHNVACSVSGDKTSVAFNKCHRYSASTSATSIGGRCCYLIEGYKN